ncbi:hypothetical protein [Halobacillus andaensis]|uniref:hypothetical protein n=1 Tax=Halobacillus andaensis TaxID=1176239 RepID=UPI003D74BE8C
MTVRQWVWVNFGSTAAFVLFVLLTLSTGGLPALVVMTEIIGFLALLVAITTIIYHRNEAMWMAVSVTAYMVPWLVFAIGYELNIGEDSNYYHLWFVLFYMALTGAIVFLKKSFLELEDQFKLFPVFLLFFHAMLLIFMIVLHIWWLLPI